MERLSTVEDGWKCSKFIKVLQEYIKSKFPIFKWFPKYKSSDIFPDAVAGFTVGLTAIPQSMAYAGIAGLTPEYGLFSSFVPCLLYIFLGSCRQMTIGPTAVVELLTFETCGEDFPACVILTGFYVGLIQLIMAIFQLGCVVSLISEPVTIGFVSGAALTICSSQVKSFLGLEGPKGKGFIGYWKTIFQNIYSAKLGDSLMGAFCVIFLIFFKNLKDWAKQSDRSSSGESINKTLWFLSMSRNALVVIISSIVAFLWTNPPFQLTGKVKSGLSPIGPPSFYIPSISNSTIGNGTEDNLDFWQSFEELGTGPLSVALISILQNVAIAKAFGSGQSINANQEMIALGICHVVGSFFSAIPVSGSFTRSAVNEASGVRSPISGIFTAGVVLLALSLLTPSFYFIPKSSLAAMIFCAVLPMIEFQSLIPMWKVSKLDVMGTLVTFFASLILGMEYGIMIGVAFSLALYLIQPVRPSIKWELVPVLSHCPSPSTSQSNDPSCSHQPDPIDPISQPLLESKLVNISQQEQTISLDISPDQQQSINRDISKNKKQNPHLPDYPIIVSTRISDPLLSEEENYLLVVTPESGFLFPSVDYIRSFINERILMLTEKCKWIVLDCKHMINLDYTSATALASLSKGLQRNGKNLVFINCKENFPGVLEVVGLNNRELNNGTEGPVFNSLHTLCKFVLRTNSISEVIN